jgi:hypothetical protein
MLGRRHRRLTNIHGLLPEPRTHLSHAAIGGTEAAPYFGFRPLQVAVAQLRVAAGRAASAIFAQTALRLSTGSQYSATIIEYPGVTE